MLPRFSTTPDSGAIAAFGATSKDRESWVRFAEGGRDRRRQVGDRPSEWNLIGRSVAWHGIPADELVRSRQRSRLTTFSASLRLSSCRRRAVLFEEIYGFRYMMATLKRHGPLHSRRGKEFGDLVATARRTTTEAVEEVAV